MKTTARIAMVSFLHGAVDFLCAFAVYGVFHNPEDPFLVYLIYSFCAFALQMPMGIVLDYLCLKKGAVHAPYGFAFLGAWLTLAGVFLGPVTLGIGNALFHTGGGVMTMLEDEKEGLHGRGLGVFVAPGAVGLFLGGYAKEDMKVMIVLSACVLFAAAFALLYRLEEKKIQIKRDHALPETAVLSSVAACFLVVVLRSGIGLSVSFPWKTGFFLSFLAVLALAAGKAAGGFFGAAAGLLKTALISLSLSAVFFIGKDIPVFGLSALFLFNMTMPLTLYALAKRMNGMHGTAFGILTFALFIGFVLVHAGWFDLPYAGTIGSLVSLCLLNPNLKGIS